MKRKFERIQTDSKKYITFWTRKRGAEKTYHRSTSCLRKLFRHHYQRNAFASNSYKIIANLELSVKKVKLKNHKMFESFYRNKPSHQIFSWIQRLKYENNVCEMKKYGECGRPPRLPELTLRAFMLCPCICCCLCCACYFKIIFKFYCKQFIKFDVNSWKMSYNLMIDSHLEDDFVFADLRSETVVQADTMSSLQNVVMRLLGRHCEWVHNICDHERDASAHACVSVD